MTKPPTILSFSRDIPNMLSLLGLFSAILAIYFAILEVFSAAMIGLAWAVFFDWTDGVVARRMQFRTDQQRMFGGQLDSLIDVVSFGLCPAIILLSYGNFDPWFIPGAFCIVAAGVLRLSYFNVYGLTSETRYQGLPIDSNGLCLVTLFMLKDIVDAELFSASLYITILVLAGLNVSSIKFPKLAGKWYYAVTSYVIFSSAFFGYKLLA
jgi:CDP-diacylglycerol--serine O-phosphatidyltransferase